MKLSKRLQACAALVTPGCRLADIGCDHGYIPVYLVQSGRITAAIASDINERPLSACRSLVAQCGYEAQITCVLSDGTEKLDLDAVDDLLLAGMGGELIASWHAAGYTKTGLRSRMILFWRTQATITACWTLLIPAITQRRTMCAAFWAISTISATAPILSTCSATCEKNRKAVLITAR